MSLAQIANHFSLNYETAKSFYKERKLEPTQTPRREFFNLSIRFWKLSS